MKRKLLYPIGLLCIFCSPLLFRPASARSLPAGPANPGLKAISDMADDTSKVRKYLEYFDKDNTWQKDPKRWAACMLNLEKICEKIKDSKYLSDIAGGLVHYYEYQNDISAAFDQENIAWRAAEKIGDRSQMVHILGHLSQTYVYTEDYKSALGALQQALAICRKMKPKDGDRASIGILRDIADLYSTNLKQFKPALAFDEQALAIARRLRDDQLLIFCYSQAIADYVATRQFQTAYDYAGQFLKIKNIHKSKYYGYFAQSLATIYRDAPESVFNEARISHELRLQEAARLYRIALDTARSEKYYPVITQVLKELSALYATQRDFQQAYTYATAYQRARDSLDNNDTKKKILQKQMRLEFSKRTAAMQLKQQLTDSQLRTKRIQSNYFIGGIIALFLLSVFIWRNYANQLASNRLLATANEKVSAANMELSEQRTEITFQRDQLAGALTDLRNAQKQLVQAEKMASLGELTAGIAHEIQNPLNFVNNFSEVTTELARELRDELDKGDIAEAKFIAADIEQNLEKITHHGKRADGIVKGMLEHSRASAGKKEPADINKLVDEYLRLSYHGLRAKDKMFNAELVTVFDENLPLIPVVSQDIGRVMLNLFNNAFYALQQRMALLGNSFKPVVTVKTGLENNHVVISVHDNGIGIPAGILDKVMQPFFTTKPTGQGTGLGLSLSYDIIVKVHGGQLSARSENGETAFVILLPYRT